MTLTFNSRSLGFFHAPYCKIVHDSDMLSIPVPWDFSMHPMYTRSLDVSRTMLSIPVSWDFSMHLQSSLWHTCRQLLVSFNSRYLGFFHAPITQHAVDTSYVIAFNSRYLGFFHAPQRMRWTITWYCYLSIPVTWDFSMHLTMLTSCFWHTYTLSIPVSWDFSMHRC